MGLFEWLRKKKIAEKAKQEIEEAAKIGREAGAMVTSSMEAAAKFGKGILQGEKRKSPKEVLESEKEKGVEHLYLKLPRRELMDISLKKTKFSVTTDEEKFKRILEKVSRKQYATLHTHPASTGRKGGFTAIIPSHEDMNYFFSQPYQRTMFIAQPDKRGKIIGYFCLKKTKKTRSFLREIYSREEGKYERAREEGGGVSALKDFCKKTHLRFRFILTKGHVLDPTGIVLKKKKKTKWYLPW